MTLEARTRWHRYYLAKLLFQDKDSSTWEAFDVELQKTYRLTLFYSLSKKNLTILQKEMKLLNTINNPVIPKILQANIYKNYFYYTTSYIQGNSLFSSSKKKSKLSFEEIGKIFSLLSYGIHQLHEKKIYHGNITKKNVIIDESGNPHLLNIINTHKQETLNNQLDNEYVNYLKKINPLLQDKGMLSLLFFQTLAQKELTPNFKITEESLTKLLPDNISDNLKSVSIYSLPYKNKKSYLSCKEFSKDLDRFLKGELALAYKGTPRSIQFVKNNSLLIGLILSSFTFSSTLALYYQKKNNEYLDIMNKLTKEEEKLNNYTHELKKQEYNLILKNTLESISFSIARNIIPTVVNTQEQGDKVFKKLVNNKQIAAKSYAEWSNLYRLFALKSDSIEKYKHFLHLSIKIGKEGMIKYSDQVLFDDVICNATFLQGSNARKEIYKTYPNKDAEWYKALYSYNSSIIKKTIEENREFKFLHYRLVKSLIFEKKYEDALEAIEKGLKIFNNFSLFYTLQGQIYEELINKDTYSYVGNSILHNRIEYNFIAASNSYKEALYYNKFSYDALAYYIELQERIAVSNSSQKKEYYTYLRQADQFFHEYYSQEIDPKYKKKILPRMMRIYNIQGKYHQSLSLFSELKALYPNKEIASYFLKNPKKEKDFFLCFSALGDTYKNLKNYKKELETYELILKVINMKIEYRQKKGNDENYKKRLLHKKFYESLIKSLKKKANK